MSNEKWVMNLKGLYDEVKSYARKLVSVHNDLTKTMQEVGGTVDADEAARTATLSAKLGCAVGNLEGVMSSLKDVQESLKDLGCSGFGITPMDLGSHIWEQALEDEEEEEL